MATSEIQICNSALVKVGAELISSLSEDKKSARLCNERYALVRDEVLASHPWNFAISRVALAKTPNVPSWEYDNEFLIPADVLRILEVSANEFRNLNEVKWSVETSEFSNNRVLLTNESTIKIKYIKQTSLVQFYSATFVECLAARLAHDICYSVTQSSTLSQQLFGLYERLLRDARSFDAQEGYLQQVEANEWIDVRG